MHATKPRPSKKEREEELLDEALEETFPASDTPALVAPGGGITGPDDASGESKPQRKEPPPQKSKRG
jgi:hypothetical protein